MRERDELRDRHPMRREREHLVARRRAASGTRGTARACRRASRRRRPARTRCRSRARACRRAPARSGSDAARIRVVGLAGACRAASASTMCGGVSKSGSPRSRWRMRSPACSRAVAAAITLPSSEVMRSRGDRRSGEASFFSRVEGFLERPARRLSARDSPGALRNEDRGDRSMQRASPGQRADPPTRSRARGDPGSRAKRGTGIANG